MAIKGKPDVSAFLDTGNTSEEKLPRANKTALKSINRPATEKKKAKPVLMPEIVFNAIKDRVYEERKKGNKVTENEIIVNALINYLEIKID